jgi:HEPN domain-containing protein
MQNNAFEWLKRAKSNLNRAKESDHLELREIVIEDLLFDAQQSAEKAFKSVLVKNNIDFPKTHSISKLIELLKENDINVPDELLQAMDLTIYAVQLRYPMEQEPVTNAEYKEAVEIAEKVYNWAKEIINI